MSRKPSFESYPFLPPVNPGHVFAVYMSDSSLLIHRPEGGTETMVICLCADWCGTCRDYRTVLADEAPRHAGTAFAWVDVEDDDELLGDLDIETFPTLLVTVKGQPRFFGPVLPGEETLRRLLRALDEPGRPPVQVDAEVASLAAHLNSLIGVQS